MISRTPPIPAVRPVWAFLTFGLIAATCAFGAEAAGPVVADPASAANLNSEAEKPIVLSPFSVTTAKDKGYKATNAISGTRLDSPIKDLPMSLEVITDQFIRDTGASSLREALKFSAGVQIQSQNDYTRGNAYQNPGGVNNPNGQTSNKTDSTFVMRGFLTENALRDGFRRKASSDTVNINRIEVVRGPAALLYGIGNFGGVVNYLVKTPESTRADAVDLTFGSYAFKRATLDSTGPLGRVGFLGESAYRLTGALEEGGDFTDHYDHQKFFVAPVFSFKPWPKTEILVDTEYGEQKKKGIGFQSLRARADISSGDANGGQERFERAGFLSFPGLSLRTMRWSGPDTFQNSHIGNIELKLTQELTDDLHLLAAVDHSSVSFLTRDVNGNVTNNVGPSSLWSTVVPVILNPAAGDREGGGWGANPVPNSIVQYSWSQVLEGTRADQARVELNYKLNLFEDNKWAAMKNNFLVGVSTEQDKKSIQTSGLDTANSVFNYKSAADPREFRFGTQGDGTPDRPIRPLGWNFSNAKETGYYAIYNGSFLDGRVTILGGLRRDRNSVSTQNNTYRYADGSLGSSNAVSSRAQTDLTRQIGISVSPIKQVSFFALTSGGLNPNFDGLRDLTGNAIGAVKAKNKEIGLKFDLFGGRVSGSISKYKITRTGVPNGPIWWAPQTAYHRFDPNKPTVYKITSENPDAATRWLDKNGNPTIDYSNNYAYWGDLTKLSQSPYGPNDPTWDSYRNDAYNPLRVAIQNAWTAAKTSGAVRYFDTNGNQVDESAFRSLIAGGGSPSQNGGPNAPHAVINASTPEGAAYLDSIYNYTREVYQGHPGADDWPGWFFGSAPAYTGYNSATQDFVGFDSTTALYATQSDQNSGYDGQLIITPVDEWQIIFNFTHNNHKILTLGSFPKYPYYAQDRWTPWLFPNGNFGLRGVYGKNEQYSDESDSSTYQYKGQIFPGAQGQDYPKDTWSLFTNYRFDKWASLKGLVLGGGVRYEGPKEFASGYTHGGGAITDNNGNPVVMYTDRQYTVDIFGRYDFQWKGHKSYVQVNVYNVLDDQHRYGFLYAPGRSINIGFGTKL
ncbi:MAG: TonB-dependent receptor plug domain-containing protein [Opitutae bacterium]|nr:TonB-dependent receptor plug domain-containing protein [Opitutae bacterium]